MKKAFCMFLLVALVGILSIGLSGCKFISSGGGWLNSSIADGKKATFGFNVHATPVLDEYGNIISATVKGQFQYNDHGVRKFHGEFTDVWLQGWLDGWPCFAGTTKDGLTFYVFMWDADLEGPGPFGDTDLLAVVVFGADGNPVYQNWGELRGGNIQFKVEGQPPI
jgi:hypothetical protein